MKQVTALPSEAIVSAEIRSHVIAQVLLEIKRLWGTQPPSNASVQRWVDRILASYGQIMTTAQLELATQAAVSTDEILAAQGYAGPATLYASAEAFAGVDIQGRPIDGVFYSQALKVTRALENPEVDNLGVYSAWRQATNGLLVMSQTALSDTFRQTRIAQMQARPKTKFVRLIRPPCCARCAILAGKTGGETMDFKRHPGCDCDAIPVADYDAREDNLRANGWIVDPQEYFDSLSEAQQNQIFTKAGAQAIRDGADINQVVNSRRGMDAHGAFTSEGTTKRGWASDYLLTQYNTTWVKGSGRYKQTSRKRMSVGEIYRRASSQDEALTLLHANGYLTDASPDLSGKFSFFTRDGDVLAAKKRVATARRETSSAVKNPPQRASGTGGGKPPVIPPDLFTKFDDGDENPSQIFRKVRDEYLDWSIPISHIVYGRVRTDSRVEGMHAFSRQDELARRAKRGEWIIGSGGKTAFPKDLDDQKLIEFLGSESRGVVVDTLTEPESVDLVTTADGARKFFLTRTVSIDEENSFELLTVVGLRRKRFVIESSFPLQGDGISRVTQEGNIELVPWR